MNNNLEEQSMEQVSYEYKFKINYKACIVGIALLDRLRTKDIS